MKLEQIKAIALKLLFPTFSNKITWATLSTGVLILTAPTIPPLIVWLIDTINANTSGQVVLAAINNNTPPPIYGVALILMALAHNIAHVLVQNKQVSAKRKAVAKADKKLLSELLELLPSDSGAMHFLNTHDFYVPFYREELHDLRTFIFTWDNTQKHFIHPELEVSRATLLKAATDFIDLLSNSVFQLNRSSMYSCITEKHQEEDYIPERTIEAIQALNKQSALCYQKHQQLIQLARQKSAT